MAEVAIIYRPCYFAIVTGATEFTVDNLFHRYIVRSNAHFETHLGMTHPALKTDTMKPVRVNYRPDAFLLRISVEHDISIFRLSRSIQDKQQQRNYEQLKISNVVCTRFTQNLPAILSLPHHSGELNDSDCTL